MNSNPAPVTASPAVNPAPKRRRWLLLGCGGILGLLLIVALTVAITIWWLGRPIKPVVLSEAEKKVVEQKLEHLSHTSTNNARAFAPSQDALKSEPDRIYVPGSRELRLTEREINGLLHQNTDLGDTLRLEFGRNAINAYVARPIPEDVPLLGGHMFRARGRFKVSIGNGGEPYAILEDVTVFGLSLPKAWLGGIKGENLLKDAMGQATNKPVLQGVKSLRVEPGALVLEVQE